VSYETLVWDRDGAVVRITLNRPDAANGMNDVLAAELAAAAARCDQDASIRAVVLTGSGRFFSAGGDLRAMGTQDGPVGGFVKGIADDLHRATSTFARTAAPLVVAVNGVAAGAGFSLAVSGDLVLAAASASFTMAYTRAGLSPDGGATYHLPRLIGLRRTQELILTNRTLSADEAAAWGLVTRVVPDDELADSATELAGQLAAGSSAAHGTVKRLLLASFGNGLEEQMELEGRGIAARAGSPDGQEGIRAFLEKRRPVFG
jgi:2-(1,2-epoxy-1,2-dihydrophenyl)acetyl-CoA isomerase